jgi:hypothetical protein
MGGSVWCTDLRAQWVLGQASERLVCSGAAPPYEEATKRAARAERLTRELLAIGDESAAREMLVSMLTHRARSCLSKAGIYPASRPELPDQLRATGEHSLATALSDAISGARAAEAILKDVGTASAQGPKPFTEPAATLRKSAT